MNNKKYIKLILKTKLADFSNIKGFMILRPYGYKIWENIKNILNKMLIKTKHQNVYFPLLIPKKLFFIESNHIKNFSKECAIVTHSKFLIKNNKIIVDPSSKLKEELIIRPTSETIIWNTYKKWIQSYRDLPILINQWSNVVRLELKNKIFIRNSEFFLQEGHTAHKNKKEAFKEIKNIKRIYKKLIKYYLSIPYISGLKSNNQKFSGAESTYSFESLTNNGKCLQLATIHFLAKNFSKAFNVTFTNKKGIKKYVWSTSWGVSTRLIGAIIMIHSDKNGLILPPKISPIHIVIIPIIKNKKYIKKINIIVKKLKIILKKLNIKYDNNLSKTPGYKFYKYENKGVPIRITIGKKEINKKIIEITRRDNFKKYLFKINNKLYKKISNILKNIQNNIYKIAKKKMKQNTFIINNYKTFKNTIKKKGGFIISNWDNKKSTELKIKNDTKATIRCIINKKIKGKCIYTGNKSYKKVVFGKSY
ncbi:proline--tRNA ligase [Candidatus Shikimatogenerans bostrichidophilus]|uniref:proline--tRNA ligase n=1 Tax=Candidatus Shikimatogenerans bostrichidophilus TaxID=2943807 RepID=UPI002966B9F5